MPLHCREYRLASALGQFQRHLALNQIRNGAFETRREGGQNVRNALSLADTDGKISVQKLVRRCPEAGARQQGETAMNRTGTEQQPDTLSDTLGSVISAESLKYLEAGTGIEPVFTDLQSVWKPNEIKPLLFQNRPLQIRNIERKFQHLFSRESSSNPGAEIACRRIIRLV